MKNQHRALNCRKCRPEIIVNEWITTFFLDRLKEDIIEFLRIGLAVALSELTKKIRRKVLA